MEKLKLLSVTGGVPKYLEEINIKESAEENIKKIVNALSKQNCSVSEIAKLTERPRNGDISEYLHDLEVSGFIKRDYVYNLKVLD